MIVRTRFAPSPTGIMHVGGVRTALFAWLLARQAKGQFILRLEDTDQAREVAGSDQHIMDTLRWLGLDWDEGPDKAGPHGPYRQSQRLDTYKRWAQKLIEDGRAYADPFTEAELVSLRDQAKHDKKPFLFREHRPANPPAWDGSRPLRFKSEPKDYQWQDEVMGELSTGAEAVDDFILIKSDGYPTYNFAHIIDDHEMAISHVIRSQEFLPSVPKYLNLYEALGLDRPTLATLPYVLGPDGKKKLSKRDGAKDVLDYRDDGYLADAVLNYLASLGWNDGTEQEVFSRDELIAKFKLSRVQKSGARFDPEKLAWMNWQHIKLLIDTDFESLIDHLINTTNYNTKWKNDEGRDYLLKVFKLACTKSSSVSDLINQVGIFTRDDIVIHLKGTQLDVIDSGLTYERALTLVNSAIESLEGIEDFSATKIEEELRKKQNETNAKPREFLNLIRTLVSGQLVSPNLFEMVELLGKDKAIERLKKSLESR